MLKYCLSGVIEKPLHLNSILPVRNKLMAVGNLSLSHVFY